jgi:hypothetical protein
VKQVGPSPFSMIQKSGGDQNMIYALGLCSEYNNVHVYYSDFIKIGRGPAGLGEVSVCPAKLSSPTITLGEDVLQ